MAKKKYCSDCDKMKDKSQFNKRTGYQKGMLSSFCKKCIVKRSNLWKDENKAKYNLYQLKYYHKKQNELKRISPFG
jgi:hypothetical protein